jgi:tetratricopeptide (TPR) repeat protein
MADSAGIVGAREALGRELAELRHTVGLTQHGLASLLPGFSRSTLANAETGQRSTTRGFWECCDAALETGGTLAGRFDQIESAVQAQRKLLSGRRLAARVDSGDRQEALGPSNDTATRSAAVDGLDGRFGVRDEAVRAWEERTTHADADSSGAAHRRGQKEKVTMAARRAREFALSHQAELSAETMEQVFEDVQALAVAYQRQPLPDVLTGFVEAQETIFILLEQHQRPAQARDLYLLAGITGGLLAKAAHDLAEPRAAMTHARSAFVCAENADHDGLRGWVRGLQTLIAYWAGRYGDAVHYARTGAEFAGRSGGTSGVWLPAGEGRAWAALGNAPEARDALDRAERAWDTARGDDLDDIGGLCTFTRARQTYYAADAFSWLPDEAATAAGHAARAVDAYQDSTAPEWGFGDQAGSHAGLAIARLRLGDLDGARAAIDPVLDLPPERRVNGIVACVRRVHDAVRGSDHAQDPAAAELREEIDAFSRTPVAALPR